MCAAPSSHDRDPRPRRSAPYSDTQTSSDTIETLWYHRPPHEREAAAALYAGVGLETLALPARPYNALRRSKWYPDVAALMRTGAEVSSVRGIGVDSLQSIDAALQPLFRHGVQVAQVTVSNQVDAELLDRALYALAHRADFNAEPWYGMPQDQRAVLAAAFRSQPLARLGLAPSTRSALHAVPAWLDIGVVARLDEPLARSGFLPQEALSDLHAGLVAHARHALEEREFGRRFVAAIQAIVSNPQLRERTLAEVSWPTHVVELCPHPTLRDLDMDAEALLQWWTDLGRRPAQREALLVAAERLAALPGQFEAEAWAAHWRSLGLQVLPEGYEPDGVMDMAAALTDTIRHVVLARHDERDWSVLRHRFGLGSARRLTLADLGEAYGLTRERVRQIESKVLKSLRSWLTAPDSRDPSERLHPDVAVCFDALENLFAELRHTPMVHNRFVERCQLVLGAWTDASEPIVRLLATMADIAVIPMRHSDLQSIWALDDPSLRADIALRVAQLHEALTQRTAAPLTDVEIAVAINEANGQRRITVSDVHAHVDLCSTIELLPDGRYAGRLEALARMLQVERILGESGEPLHLSDIERRINQAAAQSGRRLVKRLNLSNQMSTNRRLVPIGRSGYWALREWADVETGTVLALLERCLVEHNRPLTPDEIHGWIAARRPVSVNSVLAYLSMGDQFAKYGAGAWGLARWSASRGRRQRSRRIRAMRGDRLVDRVRVISARTLADRPDRAMPLVALRNLLMRELSIPSASAYHYIAQLEELETWRMGGSSRKAVRWRGTLSADS